MQDETFESTQHDPGTPGTETKKEGGNPAGRNNLAYLKIFDQVTPEELEAKEPTEQDWLDLVDALPSEIQELKEGKIVKGTVYSVSEKEVILDVGFKSEGTIPIAEFANCAEVKHGDAFDVFLEKMENQDGLIVLSKIKADFLKAWDEIKDAYDSSSVVSAIVDRRIKGGLVVKLMGVDAFLPGSQIALRQVPNLDEMLNESLDCKIIKLNKRRRNIVVSRRVVLEEEREEKKKTLLAELEVGEEREGIVKNITDFGAFVDLGGIDGLLHLTDLTWGRVSHPSEVVAISDKLKIKILDFDRERERISLGLKQLTPYPWEGVEDRYPIGKKMRGKVVSITDYGAFVELEKGIEGLIHISEMSWTRHVKHPSKVVAIGDTVEAVVLNVDKEHEKISLGLKQLEPDPWKALESKYPPGTRLRGKVRNLTNFGAFVEIEDGIDGLVHISDMSWAKRIRHPSEMVKKGDDVEVVVLEIDSDKRRISLGMKQTRENPWTELATEFNIGTETGGMITRILDRGAVVELRDDVEGFVPLSHLGVEGMKQPAEFFDNDMKLPLKVIKVDPQNKRIVLSVNAYFEGRPAEEMTEYRDAHPRRAVAEPEVPEEKPAAVEAGAEADDYDDIPDIDVAAKETAPAPEAEAVAEPAVEEPAVEETVVEEAAVEETVVEEVVVEEPTEEEPAVEAPAAEPVAEEPETPVVEEQVELEEPEDKKGTE